MQSVETLMAKPARGGTFAQCLRAVLEIADLSFAQADEYIINFCDRFHWLIDVDCSFNYTFSAFSCVNEWALKDTFLLDSSRDEKTIRLVRDSLWFTMTGRDPRASVSWDDPAVIRLQELGAKL